MQKKKRLESESHKLENEGTHFELEFKIPKVSCLGERLHPRIKTYQELRAKLETDLSEQISIPPYTQK